MLAEQIEQALDSVKPRITQLYLPPLLSLHKHLHEEGRHEEAKDVWLLMGISELPFGENPNQPFGPPDGWGFHVAERQLDIRTEVIPALKRLEGQVVDADLRARILDFRVIVGKDVEASSLAVDEYLRSGENLVADGNWSHAMDRLERALALAVRIGRDSKGFNAVSSSLEQMLAAAQLQADLFTFSLVELMHRYRIMPKAELAAVADEQVVAYLERPDDERNEDHLRRYLELSLAVRDPGERVKVEVEVRTEIAKSLEREAESSAEHPHMPNLLKAHHLKRALQAWRDVPGAKDERKRVERLLVAVQLESLKELRPLDVGASLEQESKAVAENVKAWVSRPTLLEALLAFAALHRPPSQQELNEQFDASRNSPLTRLFSFEQLDGYGRTAAIEPEEEEAKLDASLIRYSHELQHIVGGSVLAPALGQLIREWAPTRRDLVPIVCGNPFVRPGHEEAVVRGLQDGLSGNLLSALYILIPQIEDGIRYAVENKGELVSSVAPKGTQRDFLLGRLLEGDTAPVVTEIFGEEVVLALRAALISPYGANFRNEALHGRLPDSAFQSAIAIYIFWFFVWLLVAPVLGRLDGDS